MIYDDFLVKFVGQFGRYQRLQYTLVCLPAVCVAWAVLSWTFTGAILNHRCLLLNEDLDSPFDINGDLQATFKCSRPANLSFDDLLRSNFTRFDRTEPCIDGYVWDYSRMTYSAVNRWEIVCERSWIRATVQSIYYFGQAFGSLLFGLIGDRFGRKIAFMLAIMMQSSAGILMAIVPWFEMFIILRFFSGFSHPGALGISAVIGIELVGPAKRYIGCVLSGIFFGLGQIILASLAYAIRNYQHLQLAISLPYLLFLSYWFLVPESARWLIAHNRIDEAEKVLEVAAQMNKRRLPADWRDQIDFSPSSQTNASVVNNSSTRFNYFDLFRTHRLRRCTLIAFFCWPTVSMVYYGISMNPTLLGGDFYLNFAISGMVEIVGALLAGLVMNRFGRKWLAIIGYSVAGVSMMSTLLVHRRHEWMIITLVMLTKMFATIEYAVQYVLMPEIFPTVVRSLGMGACSMMARVGAIGASFMVMYLAESHRTTVIVIFGICCLIAALLSVLHPETAFARGLESIDDAERFLHASPLFSFKCPVEFLISEDPIDERLQNMSKVMVEKGLLLNKQV